MKKFFLSFILASVFSFAFDKNLHSMRADFVQYTQGGGVYYSGFFVALSPHFAKWEYKQPLQKIVYLKQKELISYEPLLSQAIYTEINQTLNFLQIIQKSKQDSKDPNLFRSKIDGKIYKLFIKDNLPSRLEYEDTLGNLVIIELKNVVLNPQVSQEIFTFTPPKGVDIIKQ